jgi:hypothetical protein
VAARGNNRGAKHADEWRCRTLWLLVRVPPGFHHAALSTADLFFRPIVFGVDVCRAGWPVPSDLDNRFLPLRHREVLDPGRLGIKTSGRQLFQSSFIELAPVAEVPET